MIYKTHTFFALLSIALVACGAQQQSTKTAGPVAQAPNNSWVSVSGKVAAVHDDAFELDYGKGTIYVEMDDWDWFDESRSFFVDDDVVVYGYVDKDFYESRKIEAASVYVEALGTQVYASGVDEEDFPVALAVPLDPMFVAAGKVVSVTGREFSLDTGTGTLSVDTATMVYNPLDNEGFQRVQVGDYVRVAGTLRHELFDGQELAASRVVSIDWGGSS